MSIETLLDKLGAPARRSLEGMGVRSVEDLSRYPEATIRQLHGVGPRALELIARELSAIGRAFAPDSGDGPAPAGRAAVDAYIAAFPALTQKLLRAMRRTIRAAAPGASEKIGYGIPTFVLNGNLVHFAGYARHIGFYPGASGIAAFERELEPYKRAKGSVRFPLDEPLPLGLVKRIVTYRLAENLAKRRRA